MKMITLKTNGNVIVMIAALILLNMSCATQKNEDETNKQVEEAVVTENVKVLSVQPQEIMSTLELTSTLQPYKEVYYAPATPGRVEKVNVEAGDRFSENDVLVVMDQTQLQQAKIQLAGLALDLARFDTLIKTNTIPKQQYDQLKMQYDISKNNILFLQENSVLKAPFNGIVAEKYYQNGEMFSGAPNTQAGKAAVIHLMQINLLKAVINVTERYFPLLKQGMDVSVFSDIYPNKQFPGKVSKIYPTVDGVSRTFQVEVTITNTNELLRPGMFCRATFDLGTIEVVIVPSVAVLKMQGTNDRYVFIEENGFANRVAVSVGRRFDDNVELVSEKIKIGDKLIVSGQARLVNGSKVAIVK